MNWTSQPETESRVGQPLGPETGSGAHDVSAPALTGDQVPPPLPASVRHDPHSNHITIAKTRVSLEGIDAATDVFTLSLGEETIQLLPFRNWGQLDIHKWRVRGKLPGTPPGLDVTPGHVKVGGETVSASDPDACARLEKVLNDWLVAERSNQESARKRLQPRVTPAAGATIQDARRLPLRFRVELDKRGQVHVICTRGTETVSSIGLTRQGFNGLFSQGLMRKPHIIEVGALHDWVELDGELCSFEHGNNNSLKLEKLLNEKYVAPSSEGTRNDIVIFANAASPTGFDIQFPVTLGGVQEARRRTLNDAAIELLQEPIRCGLLQPGLILKISPPTLIFKHKTADGGEAYLDKCAANLVPISGPDGVERFVDLSQPVNYSHLGVPELAAVFNHPSVNRHATTVPRLPSGATSAQQAELPAVSAASLKRDSPTAPCTQQSAPPAEPHAPPTEPAPAVTSAEKPVSSSHRLEAVAPASAQPLRRPNRWLEEIVSRPSIRHDWFSSLIYSKLAARFSNSREGVFGTSKCWSVALSDITDISDPGFKGIFLTQKGGLGFLGGGRLARFHRGVLFLGTFASVLEGIGTDLVAMGLDESDRIMFIVAGDYLSKFGVPRQIAAEERARLAKAGAVLLGVREALESDQPIKVLWTVPADQPNPQDPQAFEHRPPALGP